MSLSTKIVVVGQVKGGSGKTVASLAALAGTCAAQGKRVLVVDADPQGTATQWAACAPENKPFPATVVNLAHAAGKLDQLIQPMLPNYDYVVVDCPPGLQAAAAQSALRIAQLCLVPFQATPADVWATQHMLASINAAQATNPGLKAFAIANRVGRSTLCDEVLTLMRNGQIELLKANLRNRASFQEAAVRGSVPALMGYSHRAAASEALAVTQEILARMGWQ